MSINNNDHDLTELIYQANYYDNLRDIEKMMEYSFKILIIDNAHKDSIEKIIYWSVYTKQYHYVINLVKLIYKNDDGLNIAKSIFYRETKMSLRKLLIDSYINLIRIKENNVDFEYKNGDISAYMKKILNLYNDIDITHLIDEYTLIDN